VEPGPQKPSESQRLSKIWDTRATTKRHVMQGNLEETPLPDLLQFLQALGRTGQLVIERQSPPQSASVYYASGKLVHAHCPPLKGEDCVYDLLTWRVGRFVFINNSSPEQETIATDVKSLLLEGMRRIDELEKVLRHLPPLSTVLHPQRDLAVSGSVRTTHREWRVFRYVDARRTIADILALHHQSSLDVARSLVALVSSGLAVEAPGPDVLPLIVPRPVEGASSSGSPSDTATALFRASDGRKTLRDIQLALGCSEHDLIEAARHLVAEKKLVIDRGQDEFRRHVS
jgi:hypothetical protein